MHGRRVLITGISRYWGAELAARLEKNPEIEQIVGIDRGGPARELARTDCIRADIRHSLIGKLIRGLGIDTVVHAGVTADPRAGSAREIHETNVIGTMNLVAACSGDDSPVQTLVVKSSTVVYGSEPDDPSFWRESGRRKAPARDSFTRDLDEVETYVREYAYRYPDRVTTTLRFANILGLASDTPFDDLFSRPVVPTVFGFDPRLQFLHEEDAVGAMEHALLARVPGVFNIAGDGVVVLSQAVAMLGKINAPVLPFVASGLVMEALNRSGLVGFPPHLVRLLKYGRVVDLTAMHEKLGFVPAYTSVETVMDYGRRSRVRDLLPAAEAGYTYEADLEALLRSKAAPIIIDSEQEAEAVTGSEVTGVPPRSARRTAGPKRSGRTAKRTAASPEPAKRSGRTAKRKSSASVEPAKRAAAKRTGGRRTRTAKAPETQTAPAATAAEGSSES